MGSLDKTDVSLKHWTLTLGPSSAGIQTKILQMPESVRCSVAFI